MAHADTQTIHLTDDAQRLALEQAQQLLASDLAVVRQHQQRAQDAQRVASTRYTQSLARLAKLAQPDLELSEGVQLKGDPEAHTISVRRPKTPSQGQPPVKLPVSRKAKRANGLQRGKNVNRE